MPDLLTDPDQGATRLVIVTGMSGAGRSTAAHVLEDEGWFVVDNLPPQMLSPLAELALRAGDTIPRLAAVVDVRGRAFFVALTDALEDVRAKGVDLVVLFLEADDPTLVRRFESVRRPHPLQPPGTVLEAIQQERVLLGELRSAADILIDSSEMNVHQLRAKVRAAVSGDDGDDPYSMHLTILSFGFKHGIPLDAENIADVRFLPNPHWVPSLRDKTGLDDDVADYVHSAPGAADFLDAYTAYLNVVTRGYRAEGKRYAVAAVGCTGGKHRSVAMAERLAVRMTAGGVRARAARRDLGRE
jgi:UPF0042 nucleotide-binding protein